MSAESFDFVLITCRGRDFWLAQQLLQRGFSVAIVDQSEFLSESSLSYVDGPFGYFASNQILDSQKQRLLSDASNIEVPYGFTVWLEDGPVELRGPLTQHRLERLKTSSQTQDFLEHGEFWTAEEVEDSNRLLKKQTMRERWLFHLAHYYHANKDFDNSQTFESETFSFLKNKFHIRRCTRKSYFEAVDQLTKMGAKYFDAEPIENVSVTRNKIDAISLDGAKGGRQIIGNHFVWSLSGAETAKISENLANVIFPKGISESSEAWVHAAVHFSEDEIFRSIPDYVLIIDELFLKWNEHNYLILNKGHHSGQFDLWFRLDQKVLNESDRLDEVIEKITELLMRKMGGLTFDFDSSKLRSDLGYAIYNSTQIKKPLKSINLKVNGPEYWPSYSWHSRFKVESELLADLCNKMKEKKTVSQRASVPAKTEAEA